MKPERNEYVDYYQYYIDMCPSDDMATSLSEFHRAAMELLNSIPEDKGYYAYDEGKWTVKQVIQHCIDTERIFNYRMLCIARGEKNPLPGFDHNEYTANSKTEGRTIAELANEFDIARQSTINLVNSLDESVYTNMGNTNGVDVSVRAIGFFTAGHCMHHMNILKERYL